MFLRRKVTTDELAERQGKTEYFNAEIVENPDVRRSTDGNVRSVVAEAKARFKGTIKLTLRGDVASAYWSVTPGMTVRVGAVEVGKGEYEVESIEVVRQPD